MEHFPSLLSRAESAEMVRRLDAAFDEHGFGLWAVEVGADASFIGFCGLSIPGFEAPFMPAVEVGWRLGRAHWGNGYATEAARAAVEFGFNEVGLDEIVSFALPANTRSIAVMARLGMSHDPRDDFDHPRFIDDERMRRHVLYRLSRQRWAAGSVH